MAFLAGKTLVSCAVPSYFDGSVMELTHVRPDVFSCFFSDIVSPVPIYVPTQFYILNRTDNGRQETSSPSCYSEHRRLI